MTREEEIKEAAVSFCRVEEAPNGFAFIPQSSFVVGALWADEHPHWISVEDKLPPMDKDVIVITKAKRLIIAKCCYPAPLNDWWDSDGRYMQNDKPTHWMPLPQAPKKGD